MEKSSTSSNEKLEEYVNAPITDKLCPFFKTPCKQLDCISYYEESVRHNVNLYCRAMVRMEEAAHIGIKPFERLMKTV